MASHQTRLALSLLLILVTASTATGQTSTGSVNGAIMDSSGAFVRGAAVRLINQATGIENQAISNEHGCFTFINSQRASRFSCGLRDSTSSTS